MPADQRRLQLFEVAREKFSEQGFHSTSMDEIAEAAGVTKPVLYQHFPSKRALYVELLEDTGRELLTALADATGRAGSGHERVELGIARVLRLRDGEPSRVPPPLRHVAAERRRVRPHRRGDHRRGRRDDLDAHRPAGRDGAAPRPRDRARRDGRGDRSAGRARVDPRRRRAARALDLGVRLVRSARRARRSRRLTRLRACAAARGAPRGRNPSRGRDGRGRASVRCSRAGSRD